jgi:crotonobetainyl-CoA:carnitine CoA-transferase CaiB-like acyl-CoA transferase
VSQASNRSALPGMLAGYRVLDLTDETALYAGSLLGSLGADVVQVEPPGGSSARRLGPFSQAGESLYWDSYALNKRSLELDLSTPAGQAAFKDLVRSSDVVIESGPVGQLAGWGLIYPELSAVNPTLVMVSVSPFGQSGPRAADRATDLSLYAASGLLYSAGSTGRAPVRPSHIPQAYLEVAIDAAWAVAVALFNRTRLGFGQYLDVSTQEALERCALQHQIMWQVEGRNYLANGSTYRILPQTPYQIQDIWATKDGYVSFGVFLAEQGARRNPRLIEWMAEEGYADEFLVNFPWAQYYHWTEVSAEDRERMRSQFAAFFAAHTKAELVEGGLRRNVMLQAEASFADVLNHPQLQARGFWQRLDDAPGRRRPGGFVKPSATTCALTRPAPRVGEHTAEVLDEWLTAPATDIQEAL